MALSTEPNRVIVAHIRLEFLIADIVPIPGTGIWDVNVSEKPETSSRIPRNLPDTLTGATDAQALLPPAVVFLYQVPGYELPIDQLPESFYVTCSGIPVVDVISVLPNIAREQCFPSILQWSPRIAHSFN